VIREAAKYGIQVLLVPIYLGYKGTDEGWIKETLANGPEKCLEYHSTGSAPPIVNCC
jgi:hypothetical protein